MTLKELAAEPAKHLGKSWRGKKLTVIGNGSLAGQYTLGWFVDSGGTVSIHPSQSPGFILSGDTEVTLTEKGFRIKHDPYSFVCE